MFISFSGYTDQQFVILFGIATYLTLLTTGLVAAALFGYLHNRALAEESVEPAAIPELQPAPLRKAG